MFDRIDPHGLSLQQLIRSTGRAPSLPGFRPTRVLVVDVEDAVPSIARDGASPAHGDDAWILCRLHARPLGDLKVLAEDMPVSADGLRQLIDDRWGPVIRHHLGSDGSATQDARDESSSDDVWSLCAIRQVSPPPSVSVVIPTFRRPHDVIRCVDSILATGYPELEVVVVDNAPDEGSTAAEMAKRYRGEERVRYLAEPTSGASRARNLGVRATRGEIVAFADDDVTVDRYWLAALVNALVEHPDVGCVTGLVIPETLGTPVQLWFEQFGGFNRGYTQRLFDLSHHRGDSLLYPYTAGGLGGLGNAAFRRDALSSLEAFDVTLGPGTPAFGAEDQDAFVRLLKSGHRVLYEPAALVHHKHRDSYGDLRWQIFTYGAGLSAALVHWAVQDRQVAVELCNRIGAALPEVWRGGHREESLPSASASCPPSLRALERLGHVYGPIAYARAVLQRRRIDTRSPQRLVAGGH
jgi:GT2 family glycosyltransferase